MAHPGGASGCLPAAVGMACIATPGWQPCNPCPADFGATPCWLGTLLPCNPALQAIPREASPHPPDELDSSPACGGARHTPRPLADRLAGRTSACPGRALRFAQRASRSFASRIPPLGSLQLPSGTGGPPAPRARLLGHMQHTWSRLKAPASRGCLLAGTPWSGAWLG